MTVGLIMHEVSIHVLHPDTLSLLCSLPGRISGEDGSSLGGPGGFTLVQPKELKDPGPFLCLPPDREPPLLLEQIVPSSGHCVQPPASGQCGRLL